MHQDERQQRYEKPIVEVLDAEALLETVGARAATTVSGNRITF